MEKSFLKKLKQATAAILSAAMVAGGVQGFGYGVSNVQAAPVTELQPNTPLGNRNKNSGGYSFDGSDSTAYVFGNQPNGGTNSISAQYTFNFAAILNETHKNNNTKVNSILYCINILKNK